MTPEQFTYWLQGFAEVNEAAGLDNVGLTSLQWTTVKDHLKEVFIKHTPVYDMKPSPMPDFKDDKNPWQVPPKFIC